MRLGVNLFSPKCVMTSYYVGLPQGFRCFDYDSANATITRYHRGFTHQ